MSFPWLNAVINDLVSRKAQLPTAIMITGAEGVGKFEVANQVARGLLCKDGKQGDGCRKCQACQLFASGNHPDYHLRHCLNIRLDLLKYTNRPNQAYLHEARIQNAWFHSHQGVEELFQENINYKIGRIIS